MKTLTMLSIIVSGFGFAIGIFFSGGSGRVSDTWSREMQQCWLGKKRKYFLSDETSRDIDIDIG